MYLDHKQNRILTSSDQVMNKVLNMQYDCHDFIIHITKYIKEEYCWFDITKPESI